MPSSISSFESENCAAKDRTPSFAYGREWAVALAVAVFAVAGLAAFNAYVDPFDSRLSPVRASSDRHKAYRAHNTALWAAMEIERTDDWDADVIVVGDSRAEQLALTGRKEERAFELEGRRILRLSFGGAFVDEALDMLEAYESRLSPELVIIGAPYELFVTARPSRVPAAVTEARFAPAYLVNLRTAGMALSPLKSEPPAETEREDAKRAGAMRGRARLREISPSNSSRTVPRPADDQPLGAAPAPPPNRPATSAAETGPLKMNPREQALANRYLFTPYHVAVQNAQGRLEELVERFEGRGVKVVLYSPPMSDPVLMELKSRNARHYDFRSVLKQIAPVYDASGYDLSTRRRPFGDGVHVREDEGEALLREILHLADELGAGT